MNEASGSNSILATRVDKTKRADFQASSLMDVVKSLREISPEQMKQEWQAFFSDIENEARGIATEILEADSVELSVANFMKAFKEIFVEVTVEDQLMAVITGVSRAIELAAEMNLEIAFIFESDGEKNNSDRLFAKAARAELDKMQKQRGDFRYVELDAHAEDIRDEVNNKIVFITDDGAYSGKQKVSLIDTLFFESDKAPTKVVLSLGGCSRFVVNTINSKSYADQVEILMQKSFPDLLDELEKVKDEGAMEIAKRMVPLLESPVFKDRILGGWTAFRVADGESLPGNIKPQFFYDTSGRIYPDSM